MINCRAKQVEGCLHGMDESVAYEGVSMSDDGTWDGESVVCDACYIAGGMPSLPFPASRAEVVAHVNEALGL